MRVMLSSSCPSNIQPLKLTIRTPLLSLRLFCTSLSRVDFPPPQSPKIPIVVGERLASVTIRLAADARYPYWRRSISDSLSDHMSVRLTLNPCSQSRSIYSEGDAIAH